MEETASGTSVAELVTGCQAGDRAAQRQLYECYHRRIYRLIARTVPAAAALDVTQQVFLQLYRKISQYSGQGSFDAWLYRLSDQ